MNNRKNNRKEKIFYTGYRKHFALFVALSGIFILLILFCLLHGKILTYGSGGNSTDTRQFVNQTDRNYNKDDWRLILVNRNNPIPENYEVKLTEFANGQAVDSRIYPELQKMFADAESEGIMPTVTSSYRTNDDQQEIMDEKISEYRSEGYSYGNAKKLAEKWVAIPGTSEHQIGMAVDISTLNGNLRSESVVWDWLNQNSYKYGFILRYPENKSNITGIIYEPWHFRYVGKEAAKEIMQKGICLEEYLNRTDAGK